MNESPIKVGDLVRIYRTCCKTMHQQCGGNIGIVRKISSYTLDYWHCLDCGAKGTEPRVEAFNSPYPFAPLSWLKRIDPGILSEDIPTEEEILT